MPPELFVFRHAPTDVSGRCCGQSDVPLEVTHESTASQAARTIGKKSIDVIWTSDLPRCVESAKLLGEELDVPIRVDRRLREISMGQWEGRRWAEIERNDGVQYRRWLENWQTVAPPSGERLDPFERRVFRWFTELDRDGTHLVIAHAGVIRALWVIRGGMDWGTAMRTEVPHLELLSIV